MGSDSKLKYLLKNTMLYTIASLGSRVIAFFLLPLYTNALTPGEYGTADILFVSTNILAIIFTLNMQDVILRFSMDKENKADQVLKTGLQVMLAGTAALALSLILSQIFHILPWPGMNYVYLFVLYILNALEGIFFQYLRATDHVLVSVAGSLAGTIVRPLLCILLLVKFRMGVAGYVASACAGTAVTLCMYVIGLQRTDLQGVKGASDRRLTVNMIRYAMPGMLNALGMWAAQGIDRYCIVFLKGMELNGIYAVSYKISVFISVATEIFGRAWGISAIKEFDAEDKDGFFSGIYAAYHTGLCLVCSILIIFNIPFSRIMFSGDFFQAWKYASMLIFSSVFYALAMFFGTIYGAVKKLQTLVASTSVSALVNIVLNLALIPDFGAYGAAFATLVSMYTMFAVRFANSRKYIRLKIDTVRNHVIYGLIILQIVAEQYATHLYAVQVIIFISLILLQRKECEILLKRGMLLAVTIKENWHRKR